MRPPMRKRVLGVNANSKNPDQPAAINSLSRNLAILIYILQFLMTV